MATRGRKPKPTALKELEGNPGKRPLNDREPKPEKKAPPCPKWLNDDAKKEWRHTGRLPIRTMLTGKRRKVFLNLCSELMLC